MDASSLGKPAGAGVIRIDERLAKIAGVFQIVAVGGFLRLMALRLVCARGFGHRITTKATQLPCGLA
ncbi:hypothetical protein [Sinimarinibacterium thermocellulolyticum]|uniref:hypothetical protein n=1 Tax=Sinimarinibacterium thermocellulolyticum TaxID=3170016 RepID=UPI00333A8703